MTIIGTVFVVVAIVAFVQWFGSGGRRAFAIGVAALIIAQVVLLLISRRYTTALQDRIIKLEMALRADRLLAPEQRQEYGRLSTRQIVALRFASDEEFPPLASRAAREQMKADDIKRAIRTWRPDFDRT